MRSFASDRDIYNTATGDYIFLYNELGSLARYTLSSEEAMALAVRGADEGLYWGAYLGIGGSIYDSLECINEYGFDTGDEPAIDQALTLCEELFKEEGWVVADESFLE